MPSSKRASRTAAVPHRRAELHDGALRLVVVADTHGEPHSKSAELIATQRPDAILHAGDIGDLEVLSGLSEIAPTWAVRGNIDAHAPEVPDALTIDVCDGDVTLFKILLLHIAVYGPKLRADAAQKARAEGASVVVCGHSHVPFIGRDKGLTVFNPGSIGPRRFHLPIVFGVMDVTPTRVDMKHIDCETGERWLP
jgi:putative phosphoesterase